MTRSQFILGIALLCVSGTLAFFISFRNQENKRTGSAAVGSSSGPAHSTRNLERPFPLPLADRSIEKMDPTNYEVTVADIELQDVGSKIEREARERLQQMTERYRLSPNQRREIFPVLVSHHADYREGIIVNGFVIGNPAASNLASDIYPLLDLDQKEAYETDLLAHDEWWGEILGQLREDLDGALESGEVEVVTEIIETDPLPTGPGRDDGEKVENEGVDVGNFFDN